MRCQVPAWAGQGCDQELPLVTAVTSARIEARMTDPSLQAALRAGGDGLYALEAGTGPIIAHGAWAERCDFACLIHHGAGTAVIGWEAAITALDAGALPGSGGEKRMLRLAASLAGDIPVRLGEAVTGIDQRNAGLVVKAVLHASGQRQLGCSQGTAETGNRTTLTGEGSSQGEAKSRNRDDLEA